MLPAQTPEIGMSSKISYTKFFAKITGVRAISKWKPAFVLKTICHNTYIKLKTFLHTWRNAKLMDAREKNEQYSDFDRRVRHPPFSLSYDCSLSKDLSGSIISSNYKAGGIEKFFKEPQATSFSSWFISSNHPKWNSLFLFTRLGHCSRAW